MMTYGLIDFLKKMSTAPIFFEIFRKDVHCTHLFNLIKDVRAKKKRGERFLLIPDFFFAASLGV